MANAVEISAAPLSCLTAERGLYQVDAKLRKLICLTSEGELYISESHKLMPQVLSFIDRLRRDQVKFNLNLVSLEFIAALYSRWAPAAKARDSSFCQAMVSDIIRLAVQGNASDVHILVCDLVTQIKFRINGELQLSSELSREDGQSLCSTIYQTMCDVAEPVFNPYRSQDGRLTAALLQDCALYGGRVATRPTDSGLLMVIRLLYDRGSRTVELEDLGYLPPQVATVNHMAARRFGINILSGPTGSGKSTTLECILKRIIALRHGKVHVLTVEDPPEYRIPGAVQTPLVCDKNSDEAVSREWARAIANAMRLDPDILMCGEIRDASSAVATFRAAMTGHGVWTTIHANDALATLTRLQDIGISPSLLGDASLVTGLINQVLVRRLCDGCKRPLVPNMAELDGDLRERLTRHCELEQVLLRGSGCGQCRGSGVCGRTVVAEVIEPDSALMEMFARKGKEAAWRYWLDECHGVSKNSHLVTLINHGVVDPRDGEQDVCTIDHDYLTRGKMARAESLALRPGVTDGL